MEIIVEKIIRDACPEAKIALIRADVVNTATPDTLWDEICVAAQKIRDSYELSWINKRPAISATRNIYKKLGKDPNRYRVSSEALCRRVVKGMDIYRINTLVDLINLVSMASGYAIGGFDADKIIGDVVTLGVGMKDERFEGIGRGLLHVEGLPLYRDAHGGIGSPTSDEERTKISLSTCHLQMQINCFAEEMPLVDTVQWTVSLLEKYAEGCNFDIRYF